jgi:hypothetical protein
MRLKTLVAVAMAAAFAVPLSTQAQSDKASSGKSGSGASGDVPAKCATLTGADREKCIKEEGKGAGGGGTTSPSPSGSGSGAPKK